MDKFLFWSIIEESCLASNGEISQQGKVIVEKLSNFSIEDIIEFELILRQLIIEADDFGVMAAEKIIEGWVSDDAYLYFRCWLIGQGQKIFEETLKNSDCLASLVPKGTDTSFEDLLYVATKAFALKTGKEEDDLFPRSIANEKGLDYNFGNFITKGTDWEDEELPVRYPQLWEKFNVGN